MASTGPGAGVAGNRRANTRKRWQYPGDLSDAILDPRPDAGEEAPAVPAASDVPGEPRTPAEPATAHGPSTATPMYLVLLAASVGAALAEGLSSAAAAVTAKLGVVSTLLVFWQAFGTVLLPLAVVALPLGYLLDWTAVRSFGRDLRVALSGDNDGHASTGTLTLAAGLAILGGAASIATWVGRSGKDRLSANVTVTITVLTAMGSLVGLLFVVGLLSRAIGQRLARRPPRPPSASKVRPFLGPLVLGSALTAGVLVLLPAAFVMTAGGGILGLAIASVPLARSAMGRRLAGKRGLWALEAAVLLGLSAPLLIDRLPTTTTVAMTANATGAERFIAKLTARMIIPIISPIARAATPSERMVERTEYEGLRRHATQAPATLNNARTTAYITSARVRSSSGSRDTPHRSDRVSDHCSGSACCRPTTSTGGYIDCSPR